MAYTLKFDGGCWPNPGGPASYGAILWKDGQKIDWVMGSCGNPPKTSNNLAEHYGAYYGIEMFLRQYDGKDNNLLIQGDSEMVIKQLLGIYRLSKNSIYYPAGILSLSALQKVKNKGISVKIQHIYREENQDCDDLTKIMLKGA